ncbi:MAG: hypothetical protein OEW93_05475 [Candidatus Bathyarchaeota archaeon]|nr:hypothetical protein [Candidatus Bathyarchaeota archaeon]MDH5791944.1 hypothetical protein [Candidatus Bathyarchaeota archaeon]
MRKGTLEWLMEHGGPVICYRTTRELLGEPDLEELEENRRSRRAMALESTFRYHEIVCDK